MTSEDTESRQQLATGLTGRRKRYFIEAVNGLVEIEVNGLFEVRDPSLAHRTGIGGIYKSWRGPAICDRILREMLDTSTIL